MKGHHYSKRIRVHRSGYHRKGYERKAFTEHRDGHIIHEPSTHVEATHVPATSFEIRDRGRPGHGPKTLPMIKHPAKLTKMGYHVDKPAEERHEILRSAVKKHGKRSVEGMLQIQWLYRRNLHGKEGEAGRKFAEDRHWVSKNL